MENIEINSQIIFDYNVRGGCVMIFALITEIREKAVKIDFAVEPVFVGVALMSTVYNKTAWMPKSVIIQDSDKNLGLTVKKWYINKFKNDTHFRIKPYYFDGETKVFC